MRVVLYIFIFSFAMSKNSFMLNDLVFNQMIIWLLLLLFSHLAEAFIQINLIKLRHSKGIKINVPVPLTHSRPELPKLQRGNIYMLVKVRSLQIYLNP